MAIQNHSQLYLCDRDVARRYGVSRATVWRWSNSDPTFPRAIRLGPALRTTRWALSELEDWERRQQGVTA